MKEEKKKKIDANKLTKLNSKWERERETKKKRYTIHHRVVIEYQIQLHIANMTVSILRLEVTTNWMWMDIIMLDTVKPSIIGAQPLIGETNEWMRRGSMIDEIRIGVSLLSLARLSLSFVERKGMYSLMLG